MTVRAAPGRPARRGQTGGPSGGPARTARRAQTGGDTTQAGRSARTSVSMATRSPSAVCTCRSTCSARCTVSPSRLAATAWGGPQDVGVLRAAPATRQVVGVMPDRQQRPARRDRVGRGPDQVRQLRRRQLDVGDEHQVVSARGRLVAEQVGLYPVDADPALPGQFGRAAQAHGREVHPGDLPAALRQPDGVPALAGPQVEGPAGAQPRQFRRRRNSSARPPRPAPVPRTARPRRPGPSSAPYPARASMWRLSHQARSVASAPQPLSARTGGHGRFRWSRSRSPGAGRARRGRRATCRDTRFWDTRWR